MAFLSTTVVSLKEWTREEVLEFPGSADGPWARYVTEPDGRGIGTVRYPRLLPRDEECAKALKKRTLTNLYNERPTWLDLAHQRLVPSRRRRLRLAPRPNRRANPRAAARTQFVPRARITYGIF